MVSVMRKQKKPQPKRLHAQLRDDGESRDELYISDSDKREHEKALKEEEEVKRLRNDLIHKLNSAAGFGMMNPGKWQGLLCTRP